MQDRLIAASRAPESGGGAPGERGSSRVARTAERPSGRSRPQCRSGWGIMRCRARRTVEAGHPA